MVSLRPLKKVWWQLHDPSFKSEFGWRINKLSRSVWRERSDLKLPYSWAGLPARWQLIQDLIDRSGYRSYLEIGCAGNACFDRISCERKVGVDPVIGGTVRKTSDEFFRENSEKFDCIFIDGLHTYDQASRDIDNSLSTLSSGGVILLHDCVPCSIGEQAVPREQGIWTGDVWKAVVERRTREDVDTAVCLIDRGIGVVLKRLNSDLLSVSANIDFSRLRYRQYVQNHSRWMRLKDYNGILSFIAGSG